MDWREQAEDIWDEIKDHGYYIIAVTLLIFVPFLIEAPPTSLPIFENIYNGSKLPILSDIYNIGRESGLFERNTWFLSVISLCAIWAIFAASWDFLSGYSGQVSFGHAAFYGFAAYVTYWLASGFFVGIPLLGIPVIDDLIPVVNEFLHIALGHRFVLDPLFALIFGGLITALFAVFIGVIALRVKGYYLALVTLAIPLILNSLANVFRELTGGNYGLPSDVTRMIPLAPAGPLSRETNALNFYLLILICFFIAIGLMMLIAYSRIGLAFQSIREDEDAAESLGINVRNYKILSFTISAFFAGIAGGLYAQWYGYVSPTYLESSFSFQVIIMCVIGGVGTITGGVIGAFLLTILINIYLKDVFSGVHGLDMLSFGVLLVVTLRYLPYGLARATKEQKRALVLGILFAIAWAIIPSNPGWGVDFLSSFLPNVEANNPLNQFISISVTSLLSIVGKVDYLGQMIPSLAFNNIFTFIGLIILFIFSLPAILVFLISEIIGLFLFEGLLGITLEESLIKAKFLIYAVVGIPFSFYLPKIFKRIRLRYWGTWPSVGRYEPD